MPMTNYNTSDMETVMSNSTTIASNVTSTADAIDGVVSAVDKRVYDYFEFFKELDEKSSALRWEESNAKGFGNWMNDTYTDFMTVKNNTEGNAGTGVPELTLPEQHQQFPSINVDPSKVPAYDLKPEAWEKLSTEEKKVIEAKLKELGFTDEEIQAIKDGNASVNKTTLDKLDAALTKLNNEGSDVRQVILEKYGFDIFNEDGSINKDKLAIAMLIDNKDPNDDYDLVALLKNKYGIDLFPADAGVPTTPSNPNPTDTTVPPTDETPTQNDDGNTPSTIHTGVGYGEESTAAGDTTDVSEIENMLNGAEDDSLLNGLDGLAGSIANRQNGFDIGFNKNDGKGGAGVAGIAGVAGLGAAATAAGLLAKKRKEDAILGDDEDDDDDDDFDDDLDDDIDTKDLLKGKLGDEIAEDDVLESNKKKKNWLYGLGIGLAGAGLAAGLLAKDDDEDEEDDD